MGTYFKPLRRKIGVVTLGLACMAFAAWQWSLFVNFKADVYGEPGEETYYLRIGEGEISLIYDEPEEKLRLDIALRSGIDEMRSASIYG